jgi:hypothetical protein
LDLYVHFPIRLFGVVLKVKDTDKFILPFGLLCTAAFGTHCRGVGDSAESVVDRLGSFEARYSP